MVPTDLRLSEVPTFPRGAHQSRTADWRGQFEADDAVSVRAEFPRPVKEETDTTQERGPSFLSGSVPPPSLYGAPLRLPKPTEC